MKSASDLQDEIARLQHELASLKAMGAASREDELPVVEMLMRNTQRRHVAEAELADAHAWMELAQEVGGVAAYRMDITENRLWWSQSVFALYGFDPAAGEPTIDLWLSAIHPDDRVNVEHMARMAIETGAPIDHQFRIIRPSDGTHRWVHDRGRIECDATGKPLRLHGVNIDMTAMRQVQEALAASEEQYRGTFEHANVGVAHVSVDGRFLRANGYLCKLLGRFESELQAVTFQDITHPDDLGSDLDLLLQLMDGKIPSYTLEKRYVRPDGTLVWSDLSVALIRNDEGIPLHFVSVITDIQQRKQAQDLVKLVLDEANHRVKNLLSVVGAIVKSSARSAGSVKQFEEAVSLRLKGIAASHDLLMGKSVDGGDLAQLIRRQLEIFTACAIERVIMDGPPLQLCPRAVHAFGMVLHELATNACKYGALANERGEVHIDWSISAEREALHFVWREVGGPEIKMAGPQGFGSKALTRMFAGSLGGKVTHQLLPAGCVFEADLPLGNLLDRS